MHTTLRCVLVAAALIALTLPGNASTLLIGRYDGDPLVIEKGDHAPNDDWYQTLVVVARNVSSKPIYFAHFELELTDAKLAGQTMMLNICYGDEDLMKGRKPDSDDKPIDPAKTVKLKVMDDKNCKQVGLFKKTAARYTGNAVLRLRMVCFGDGTCWKDGQIVKG